MRKVVVIAVVVALAGGAATYFGLLSRERPAAAQGMGGPGGGPPGGMGGRGGFGFRPPMTVELGAAVRGEISSTITVVGNLIGQQSVEVVPKTGGRLVSVSVRLGDAVRRGQLIAKIEDREIVEQVRQAEASHTVAQATIRQREADLTLAQTNVERSRNLYGRQLLPKQTLDDAEARYQAAVAQLDLSRAQMAQTEARLEELRINLANTSVTSPVDGFVARRYVDPGAWVSQNAPIVAVVEISTLRMVAHVVERDLRVVTVGDPATVEVDAYPGEAFKGQIARVAPVLDPSTRTAEMEVEVPNRDGRLKPGMYARVSLLVENRSNALLVPKPAVIDYENRRGVFVATEENRARFVPIEIGLEDAEHVEVRSGLQDGDRVVTVGGASLRNDDILVIAGEAAPDGGGGPRQPGMGGPGGRPGAGGAGVRPMSGQRPGGERPGDRSGRQGPPRQAGPQ